MDCTGHYILDGKKPVEEPDLFKWATGFDLSKRRVAFTKGFNIFVSTVFLGLDHSFGDGPPLLFETMVCRNKVDWGECWRYTTWEEAEAGHRQMCIDVNVHPVQRIAKVLLWLPSVYIVCRLIWGNGL